MGLTEKEKALLEFCLKANVDANGITDEEFQKLKDLGSTDQEIVEAIECMTLCSGLIVMQMLWALAVMHG